MIKHSGLLAVIILVAGCKQPPQSKKPTADIKKNTVETFYSKEVADSFKVFINLPNNYHPGQKKKYPVVYLLDANLYFDIMATTVNKYSDVGLAPEVILIGIGYKDFPSMDSLRTRDDTYPKALPEYEMSTSGGADKFLAFISKELIPSIDKAYQTDTAKRILMGHSLGGYFTVYALFQNLNRQNNSFSGYVAASPSIHYNDYYLLKKLKALSSNGGPDKVIKTYLSYGGLEDNESSPKMIDIKTLSVELSTAFSKKKYKNLIYKNDIFSNLDHMDTPLPTFIKGLNWALND